MFVVESDLASPDTLEALVREVRASRLPSPATRRRIREEAGLSLRDIAGPLGVGPMTVLRWEHGTEPRRKHALAYRKLLDALQEAMRE